MTPASARTDPGAARALAGKRAVVMGLGSFGGGLGAARHLAAAGARVLVTDLRAEPALRDSLAGLAGLEVELALGGHRPEDFERADLVVANPAVRQDHPLLALAREAGARITSEIELFLEAVRARIVCVTGTQGKSSTCHMLAGLLERTGRRTHLGGNIGRSLLGELARIRPDDCCVLELSSYQLAAMEDPVALGRSIERVEAVAVTNVLDDHLETHGSWGRYAEAKRRILALLAPGGVAVLPADDARLADWAAPEGRTVRFSARDPRAELCLEGGELRLAGERLARVADLRLPGDFQRENALVALGLARAVGARAEGLGRALGELRGLDHRLEPLGSFGGHAVHDNGVSTTPDSTVSALRSLPSGVCLILGGRLKALPLDELVAVARERVSRAVCFGEAGARLASALRAGGVATALTDGVPEATRLALELAPPGADVLFSPACSSFDAYLNFRERAAAFRAALPAPDGR